MALTLYGSPQSRTMRVLPQARSQRLLTMGSRSFESLAIHIYLAKKYDHRDVSLYPRTAQGEATLWRWSLWAEGQLEPWVQGATRLAPLHARLGEQTNHVIGQALATLDRALEGRNWLIDDGFTVADLNVAAILSPSRSSKLDLTKHPKCHPMVTRVLRASRGHRVATAQRATIVSH